MIEWKSSKAFEISQDLVPFIVDSSFNKVKAWKEEIWIKITRIIYCLGISFFLNFNNNKKKEIKKIVEK